MGTKRNRKHVLQPTTGPIAWELREYDDFSIKRITISFGSIPATIENIRIWHKDSENSGFDCVIRDCDPNGMRYISIEDIPGFESGDFALVEFANTDGLEIRGLAVLEV